MSKITTMTEATAPSSGDDLVEIVIDTATTPLNRRMKLLNLLKRVFLGDGTQLTITTIADGEFLKRSGTNITSGVPSGTLDAEGVQDIIGAMLVAGTNITITYNDGANTLTIDSTGAGIGGSTGASDNRILRADGAGGATVQSSAVSIGDNGDTLPVTTSASDLGGASNRWKQFWADDIIASGTGAAGGRIRFFGSGGGAAEIGSNANRKSLNFTDGINGNPGTICLRPHTPSQFVANQNDYTEEGGNSAAYFRWSSDASRDVTGLSISQADGDIHVIINVGSNDIVLKHESASSSAVNRFLCSTGADITLSANQSAEIWYDGVTQRWRVFKRN